MLKKITIFSVFILLSSTPIYAKDTCSNTSQFNVGTGIYDITGPAAEQGMMGYGMIEQKTAGILQRLYARAFIIESPCNGKRVVLVTADLGQVFQVVREHVVKKLNEVRPNLYSDHNVLIAATHQHSGPGGYSTYAFYDLTTLGFDRTHTDTIVNGIVSAILRAEKNMTPARIEWNEQDIPNIQVNRSKEAYLLNPESERARYKSDTDPAMRLLKFIGTNEKPLGVHSWFPFHGTSMNNKNKLINGDNKGYASYRMEQDFHSNYDEHAFIAAFPQSNAGDISPNPLGQEGKSGLEGIRHVEAGGTIQYQTAKKLLEEKGEILSGEVDYRHLFVALDRVNIPASFTQDQKAHETCTAAIGVSMLAGTKDGEGVGEQGVRCSGNSSFEHLFCAISSTTCQGVKPIALETGSMSPFPWTPNILPLQIVQIGQVHILAIPFEITTMAGRRLQEYYAKEFHIDPKYVVVTSLANAYAGYLTTAEEYQLQRYEAASNHFGEWTLNALHYEFHRLGEALKNKTEINDGTRPLDLYNFAINLQTGVVMDAPPFLKSFGDVETQPSASYKPGDIISAQFWGGHPRNNYRINDSFLAVQRFENNAWKTIRLDRDWDTQYEWERKGIAGSLITITWRTDKNTPEGRYRLVHTGDAKPLIGNVKPYQGTSREFVIKK